ncbi:unnamed protein product [Musa acuminata var. zebrina]
MAKVHSTPKYVPILTQGGEKKEGEETNPFRWMIEGFSTLLNHTALEIKSSVEDDEKSLCLYLFSVEVSSNTGSVVKATYELMIYDQLCGKRIQIKGEDYFHGSSRYGLCFMVPFKKISDPKSGLLVNDCCIFGAEVMESLSCKLVRECVSECLSLKKEITPQKYTWVIKNFLKLSAMRVSEVITSGGYSWHINLYPNVKPYPNFLAMFVVLDKFILFPSKTRVYVDYSLCLVDQINGKHEKISVRDQFSSGSGRWGLPMFLKWKDIQNPSRGFLHNETCIVEASLTVLGNVSIT